MIVIGVILGCLIRVFQSTLFVGLFFGWIGPFASPEQVANALTAIIQAVGDPVLRRQVEERLDLVHQRLEALLAEAAAHGELDAVEPAPLARLLFASVEGAMVIWSVRGDGQAADRVDDVIDQVLAPYRRPPVVPSASPARRRSTATPLSSRGTHT